MDSLGMIVVGIVTAFNFLVLQYKWNRQRWADLIFDLAVLFILSYLFKGSFSGLVAAMTASFIVSVVLLKYPPKFNFLSTRSSRRGR